MRAVVRSQSPEHARYRLLDRLRKSAAYEPSLAEWIEAVPGDSTAAGFGCARQAGAGVEAIIHCAANTSFSDRERDSIIRTNVGGAANLIAFARTSAPRARVVFVSTASVVTAPSGCLAEDAPFGGHENAYTVSKRLAEREASVADLDVVIARPSIVLSRSVDDRAMARSILWALPIMCEVEMVPIDPDARVDVVPVDFVADAIVALALKPTLSHRLYHVSAGRHSHSFQEILAEVAKTLPEYSAVRMTGVGGPRARRRRHLYGPVEAYLPFINADVQYDNARLIAEIGSAGCAPTSLSYIPELLNLITLEEAVAEMARP